MVKEKVDLSKLKEYVGSPRNKNIINEDFIKDLEQFLSRSDIRGTKGAKRVTLVCENFEQLSFEQAYRLINPDGFQDEIEDNRIYILTKTLSYFRTLLILAPLVWTWFALFTASTAYQQDLIGNPNDQSVSFLRLWLYGFQGNTWLTFHVVTVVDVCLLVSLLILTLVIQYLENYVCGTSEKFAKELRGITHGLFKVVRAEGISPITTNEDVEKVVDRFKGAVEKLFRDSQKVVEDASEAIKGAKEFFGTHIDQITVSLRQVADANRLLIDTSNAHMKALMSDPQVHIVIDESMVMSIRTLNATLQSVDGDFEDAVKRMEITTEMVSSANKDMSIAMQEVQKVGVQLMKINKLDMEPISQQITIITDTLGQVEMQLANTTVKLQEAASALAGTSQSGLLNKVRKKLGFLKIK